MMRTLLFICFFVGTFTAKSQCDNWSNNWGSASAPSAGNTNNFATNSWMGEYSSVYDLVSGTQYTFTISYGGCVTLRTTTGALIAFGASPFVWTATVSGTIEVHWNTDCISCGTNTSSATTSITNNSPPPTPADYTHPTTGIANERVGACLVSDCGPATYTDDGNAGNYSINIPDIYRVFCPSVAGNCMQVTFNSFNVESGYDFLQVRNGPTQSSPVITSAPNSIVNGGYPVMGYSSQMALTGALATPFSFTSTDESGCLTFAFWSDNMVTAPGWSATLQCVPCVGGPSGTSNSDCIFSTVLCSNANVVSMADGPGIVSEGCAGSVCPAGGENHSNWYRFMAQTTGNLDVTITPTVMTDDYDFAIYGPNTPCNALGNPIRCSDAGVSGVTGAMPPGTGTSEDVLGDGFVTSLNVIAGETYYLVVDKWSPSGGTGYTLSFGGSVSLDCNILPIQLSLFEAEYEPNLNVVDLTWVTQTEDNMSHYEVERSVDGMNYEIINRVSAVGNSNMETQYFTVDTDPFAGVNYYRLNQFDFDGNSKHSEIRAVNVLDDMYDILTLFPNPTTEMTEVIFNSYSKEDAVLTLTDATGKTITQEIIPVVKGGNRLNLNMSEQQSGVYVLSIVTKYKIHRTKLIKG